MKSILIHGLGQDSKSWDKVKNYLDYYNFNVICPNIFDMLKNDSYNYNNLYKNFERYIDKYDDKVNLCGLSLGGILALDYVKKHPKKINKLILIGVPYKIPKVIFNIQSFIFRFMPSSSFEKIDCSKKDFINMMGSIKDLDIENDLEKINCETLILCGKKDKFNIKSAKLFKDSIKNSKINFIENSGHEVNVDKPRALSKIIFDFFKD